MSWFLRRLSPLHSIADGDGAGGGAGGGDPPVDPPETWHSKLPEELKAEPSLADF